MKELWRKHVKENYLRFDGRSDFIYYTDGSKTPDNVRIGYQKSNGTPVVKKIGKTFTSNDAEYKAIIYLLKSLNDCKVIIKADSLLVIRQINQEWKIREGRFIKYIDNIYDILRKNKIQARFEWIPREKNKIGSHLEILVS
jgi:ribonuclease HI